LLTATWPDFCTIIAPRHPERGPEIAVMLRSKGLAVALRSAGEMPIDSIQIYIADTIGELGTMYRLAPLAFLGKSLGIGPGTTGGQNPIEAIRHGVGVLTGPHFGNFPEIYRTLLRFHGAVEVTSAATIAAEVQRLLQNPQTLADLHSGASTALGQLSGALEKTLAALLPMLPVSPKSAGTTEVRCEHAG
jgi:3-deoxy-D-manno-octulosonic-acid transferase